MRRSSVSNDEILNNSGRNIDDLIDKFDIKSDKHRLQELFSTPLPQLQRDLEMYYDRDRSLNTADPAVQREILRRLILKQKTDSLLSLTDSEICSDDQSRRDSDVGGRRERYYQHNVANDEIIVGKEQVAYSLSRVGRLLDMLSHLPWPRMSFTALGICFLGAIFISPRACVQNILFPAFRLVFGTLYPAYASYKAVRTKNVKEYVKWMMYWIVYAFFTCIETFTDIFLSWFPFYYEVKVLVVLWLLSPATKGSSVLYRKFVHPMLTRREQEIDDYLNQAKERGYTAVIQLGSKGVNYATNVIMQTALKTMQLPLNNNGYPKQRGVSKTEFPTSISDYTISNRNTIGHDENDTIDNIQSGTLLRAHSLDTVSRYRDELFEGSSDDENINLEDSEDVESEINDHPTEMIGAARSRVVPKRKTRSNSVPIKKTKEDNFIKKPSKIAVRGRRRIKNTPEIDIDIEM